MTPDAELLRRYAKTRSEDAFAELVRRHLNLVYSAALRQVNGDTHLAQDVTQTVFTDLARKAASLSRREVLTGWLYTSTHFAAAKVVRSETRRHAREQEAHTMRELLHETSPEIDWQKLRPVLDAAMHELRETDRDAILLRYFENRALAEVGAKLGVSENAARMRVERAVEKLRISLTRRGIASAAVALATVLSTNAVQLAPAGLAATVTTASLAGALATGTAFTFLQIMAMTKLKVGIIISLIIAGIAVPVVMQQRTQKKLREANEALQQQAEQISQLTTENEQLSGQTVRTSVPVETSNVPSSELLRLRGEVGRLRRESSEANVPITRDIVDERYKHGQDLARNGDAAGALKEFLWCFDEGMPRVAGYSGVRTSFLLDSIAKLGEQYPMALAALRERRDNASRRMLTSTNDFDATMDFAALNRTLKDDQNTLAVFDQLPADDPRRNTLAMVAYDQLVEQRRYSDALSGKSYAQISAQLEMLVAAMERPLPASLGNPEAVRKAQRDSIINSGAKNVEALAGSGDIDHARALAARLLVFDSSTETKALLQQHAVRAGHPDLLNGVLNP